MEKIDWNKDGYFDRRFVEHINKVAYIVQATHTEKFFLWNEWHHHEKRVSWQDLLIGYSTQVGTLDDRPIMISLNMATINGHVVLFYDSESQVTDWVLVEKFIELHFPVLMDFEDKRRQHTDAGNFHLCIHHLNDLNKAEEIAKAAGLVRG